MFNNTSLTVRYLAGNSVVSIDNKYNFQYFSLEITDGLVEHWWSSGTKSKVVDLNTFLREWIFLFEHVRHTSRSSLMENFVRKLACRA